MNKLQAYCDLVASRKTCSLCCGLTNPGTIECRQFDSDQIGPWSRWQGCLDTEVLVVGQDWGDIDFFLKGQGLDPDKNPTNDNLRELLASIGFHIGRPGEAQEQVLFFTNLILCLKKGGLQAPVQPVWFKTCVAEFFLPLVDIIRPRAVVALGQKVSEAILDAYHISRPTSGGLKALLRASPFQITSTTALFPLYHCGAGSVNRNRNMDEQIADWRKMAESLSKG